ncbi:MAG: hypothetical protein CMA92_01145 [Euryarchaeota archaeon]|nr:hypothetical protein [Euryarchaeota archaeon]
MITMTTFVILAGGKSSRMGEDKSLMKMGTRRIYNLCKGIENSKIITLCGDESRINLFEGDVWSDPSDLSGALDIIKWCMNNIEGKIQFIPCDAFNLGREGIRWLQSFENATPVDSFGNRQPLLSLISNKELINFSGVNIRELFADIPSVISDELADHFNNFNTKDDVSKLN